MRGVSHLSREKRIQILMMLVEGVSMRSISRVCDISINTVSRHLERAASACAKYHDENVRGVKGKRTIECDENWSFVYAKDRALEWTDPWDVAGTVWTWTAIDNESRLYLAFLMSKKRDAKTATKLFRELDKRLDNRASVVTDQLKAYRIAANKVWGKKAKLYQTKETAYVERHNLTIRMSNPRYARKTNAFSKKLERHIQSMQLYFVYYNFIRIHTTLKISPAMAAGLTSTLRDFDWLVDMIDENTPKPRKPGPNKGAKYRPRKVE